MPSVPRQWAITLSVLSIVLVLGAACGGSNSSSGTATGTNLATSAVVSGTSTTVATPSAVLPSPSATLTPSVTTTPSVAIGSATASPSTSAGATASPATELANNPALVAQGKQLFTQLQCSTCHSTTGQVIVGPPLNGVYQSQVQLANGQTVTADQAYIRESIRQPDAKTVKGVPSGVMVSVVGSEMSQIQADNNLDALIAYIESLK